MPAVLSAIREQRGDQAGGTSCDEDLGTCAHKARGRESNGREGREDPGLPLLSRIVKLEPLTASGAREKANWCPL